MGEKRGAKALELWCRRMVEDKNVHVDNMTTSWRDGMVFCALVSKCLSLRQLPDLIQFEQLKKEDIFNNNELAFRIAEEYLNIPALLDPKDMVDYEVPDKLSLLTYLSQFYQIFGAQENSLRVKHAPVSEANTSSSVPQMAQNRIVPKREPCANCNNPVFFAERLVINDSLYHRTCFKCARCGSVLTLGNFYETEKDHEYCCETCPDEEKGVKTEEPNRLSIAQKIALFEKETSNVLKKSLSDEEKSKSLSRQAPESSRALNDFLASQIPQKQPEASGNETNDSQSSESDDNDEEPYIDAIPILSDKKIELSDTKDTSEASDVKSDDCIATKDDELAKVIDHTAKDSSESYKNKQDTQVAHLVVDDKKEVPIDEIELLFEELAEDAIKTSLISMPVDKVSTIQNSSKSEDAAENSFSEIPTEENKPSSINHHEDKPDDKEPVVEPDENKYPDELDPFGEEENDENEIPVPQTKSRIRGSLNPFGSCSEDEDEDQPKTKPPRPPPPKTETFKPVSTNPFGSDDEDEEAKENLQVSRTPVPTPRKIIVSSVTPEPTPRSISNYNSPGHSFRGSTSSLASSTDGMSLRRKKKKAPAPPPDDSSVILKTPSLTPKKKRQAPTPPSSTSKPTVLDNESNILMSDDVQSTVETNDSIAKQSSSIDNVPIASQSGRRLIPLEECLIEENSVSENTLETQENEHVTYRRKIVPLEQSKDSKEEQNRQRQSQGSLMSPPNSESTDSLPYLNKSSHGKWKRRKGPAPALPTFAQSQPQRRILQMLPLQEIRSELEIIEVQQQGLEKQGVMLEKMIREKCEGSADNRTTEELLENLPSAKNPKEVEELILQLFELVNEKNELFRRQAELMYLKRAHRLEEEQADVEYEIRTLMAQPEKNKTDSDKSKEEALIARLVEIVQLRNEVVDNLDRDRLREAEEDLSIKQRMQSHSAKLDQEYLNQTPTKLSKKEKKKLKEAKKLKNKKLEATGDVDKDLDTSEMKTETPEKKKKKKKFLF